MAKIIGYHPLETMNILSKCHWKLARNLLKYLGLDQSVGQMDRLTDRPLRPPFLGLTAAVFTKERHHSSLF